MRTLKIMLIVLVLSVVGALSISCGPESDSTAVTGEQLVAVQRGDLTIDITAVGNLALSRTEDLAFDTAGTVEEVLVEEGDSVEEGQLLAKLDTSEWEDHIAELEDKVTAAERNVPAKERAVIAAERNVPVKLLDLLQAQVNLNNAELALEQTREPYSKDEINNARIVVYLAKNSLEDAQWELDQAKDSGDEELILQNYAEVFDATESLLSAEAKLETMLDDPDLEEVAIKQLQIQIAQGQLEDAQTTLEDAAKQEIEDAEQAVEDAKIALEDAKEALAEAMDASPEVTAPFNGFITRVNIEGGDEVMKGTVAVAIADPTKFEADILVSEMDIFQIKLGGEAWVQVDAIPGLSLPAKLSHISPTATIQSGVVNYKVTVELESMERLALEPPAPDEEKESQEVPQSIDEVLDKAVADGRISREQADMMKQRFSQASGSLTPEQLERMIEGFGQGPGGFGQRPGDILLENIELKEGLTVTVSVIVEERDDVLLVPNAAITISGRQTYAQVLSPDGTVEERAIITGISDWQYTEIIEGLSEGEKVIVPQGTTTEPASQEGPQGGIRIPGMGGFGR